MSTTINIATQDGIDAFRELLPHAFENTEANTNIASGDELHLEMSMSGEDVWRGDRVSYYGGIAPSNATHGGKTTVWQKIDNSKRCGAVLSVNSSGTGNFTYNEETGKYGGYIYISDSNNIKMGNGTATTYYYHRYSNRTDGDGYKNLDEMREICGNNTTWNNVSDGIFMGTSSMSEGVKLENIFIESNIPLFATTSALNNYIETGDASLMINGRYSAEDKIPNEYYFENDVFRTDMAYNNKAQVDHIKNYYHVGKNKIKLVRYLQKNVNGYYNNVIVASGGGTIICDHGGNTTSSSYGVLAFNTLTGNYNRVGLQGEVVKDNYIYKGVVRSNIPCAKSQDDAMKYARDEITLDEMPREKQNATDVYSYNDTTSRKWTGDSADSQDTDITSNTYADGNLISQYIMTSSQLSNVSDLIYTTQTDTLNALKLALKSHGETFITDIVDVYHVPIDVSSFVSTSSVANIPFGLYESECSGNKITVHGKIKDLGSIYITPIHNDFRDYECVEMSLYLPFCAIIPLPTDIFMNSTLTVKVGADLRSHNLRYYVFVNNEEGTSLYSYHDCAFGQSISLMGNDSGARALQCLSTGFEIMNTQRNLTFGNIDTMSSMGQGMYNQAMQGNIIGAGLSLLNGANKLEQNTQNAKASIMQSKLSLNMSQAPRIYSGSQGSGLSENDILYPYVLFNVQNTNRADIRSIYGLPCNVSGKLGKFKGFTQCDDVRVNANMPSNEKQLLIDALKEGIIL